MRTLAAAAAAAAVLLPLQASAGSKIFSSGATVLTVNGSVEFNANQNRDPALYQVFSAGNECLRIAVTSQGADLEAVLVSPDLRIWRNDDGNGSLRPLIKAQTLQRGWYPLVFSHFAGTAVNADFTFTVQRGATTSALCSGPTVPTAVETARKAQSAAPTSNAPGGAN